MKTKILVNSLIFFVLIACESLDSTGTGTIYGTVLYGDGKPVENATVKVSGSRYGEYTVSTDFNGKYSVPGLPQDTYSIQVKKNDEERSKVVELKQGSFSCDSPEERVDFSFGPQQNNLNMSEPFITPSTVSASSDTNVLFGVRVEGNPDSVYVVIGSINLGLNDKGANGDTSSGDKIYSASISSKSLLPGEYNCEFRAIKGDIQSAITLAFKVTP